jgi:putative colanic acid biosynthesis acetyltransferase WcaF
MSRAELEVHPIPVRGASPWTFRERVGLLLWDFAWPLLCRWTPKPFNAWRLFWLRVFGCRITGTPFVHQRARIQIPWHVTLNHLSNVGDRTNLYSLGEIELGPKCVVAQEAYLCTGTHDFQDPTTPLATAKITIGTDAFVGARTFVMPGVTIGDRAVVGACSLVTRNVGPETVVAGSPARFLRFKESPYLDTVEKA